MKRLRLGLWLGAWSVWLWLGLGLYRELPRSLGTPICTLPLEDGETPWGFIGDREVVVTCHQHDTKGSIRSWDARIGRSLHTWRGSTRAASTSATLGYVISLNRSDVFTDPETGTGRTFNLSNGERTPLEAPTQLLEFHPKKPLVVVKGEYSHRLSVVDLSTGKHVGGGNLELDAHERLVGCRFVGDEGAFVLLIEARPSLVDEVPGEKSPSEYRLEQWNFLGRVGRPVKLHCSLDWVGPEVCNGRILIVPNRKRWHHLVVLDLRTGSVGFDSAEMSGFGSVQTGPLPKLSADGRFIATISSEVWDVNDRRKAWAAEYGFEFIHEADAAKNSVRTLERWNALFGNVQWLNSLQTQAIRDFATGALKYRVRGAHPWLAHLSSDGKLGIAGDRIYVMTPKVDWLLLALCQTLLTLPLGMVWLMLRWRRKRKARLR